MLGPSLINARLILSLQQYGLEVTDDNQVLLVSNVKRLGPSGQPPPGPALLVPEFCYMTGKCPDP